jgi:dihydroxyacetone kinase-like protein
MEKVRNDAAGFVVTGLIEVINANRAYLSEIDGAIGDGDHGINMSKGFSAAGDRLKSESAGLSRALAVLGETLINGVGGSMGPLYGTFFGAMSEVLGDREYLDAPIFSAMLKAGLNAIQEIGEARVGDKTLVDALAPASAAFDAALAAGRPVARRPRRGRHLVCAAPAIHRPLAREGAHLALNARPDKRSLVPKLYGGKP